MITYRWNGEHWYADKRSLWKRFRQWLVWIGGWERPNGAGWEFRSGEPGRRFWRGPTPVSVLGHRMTFYGHWLEVRLSGGYLVVDFRSRYAYAGSRDGTPRSATHWLWGIRPNNHHLPLPILDRLRERADRTELAGAAS